MTTAPKPGTGTFEDGWNAAIETRRTRLTQMTKDGRTARMREHAADLYDALKLVLGVLCEAGDLNNYRNLSDEELGRVWITTAKHAGHLLNMIDGLPHEFRPLSFCDGQSVTMRGELYR